VHCADAARARVSSAVTKSVTRSLEIMIHLSVMRLLPRPSPGASFEPSETLGEHVPLDLEASEVDAHGRGLADVVAHVPGDRVLARREHPGQQLAHAASID